MKQGAIPVTDASDILAEYEFLYPHSIVMGRAVPHISPDEAEDKHNVGSPLRRKKAREENKEREKPAVKKQKKEKKEDKNPFADEGEKKASVRIDMESLTAEDMQVFEAMIPDVPMLCEEIAAKGFDLTRVMVSLTMLEVAGAVEAGAGGYYLRRAADFGGEPEYITEDDAGL